MELLFAVSCMKK